MIEVLGQGKESAHEEETMNGYQARIVTFWTVNETLEKRRSGIWPSGLWLPLGEFEKEIVRYTRLAGRSSRE